MMQSRWPHVSSTQRADKWPSCVSLAPKHPQGTGMKRLKVCDRCQRTRSELGCIPEGSRGFQAKCCIFNPP